MSKALSFDKAMKSAKAGLPEIGLMVGGAVASKKFIDFGNLAFFKDAAAANPQGWQAKAIRYQGLIKLLGALYIRDNMVKSNNKMMKGILTGVAFEGGLSFARQVMTKDDGTSMIDQIGGTPKEIDSLMNSSGMGGNDDLTDNSGVGSIGDYTDYETL